ncbi:HAD hydrolase-like protein [Shewanella eurypsychrophilus]|uniref:HAD hydrolase-like protein n=1 Tax=Shewanella eurypsychrophilus TaxID=2593656 RepID=A0ABX6V6B9_9GAMM|nr:MULTISPECIES: HAD hydrolase-like protein [Shewanella]QFU22890.1 HAD hydrolase-like protein [Shewanella sp. YLB-09]QPG58176.1 HAD hydrolase-like protein [Shewanella eurypsychrophilus]
MGNIDASVKVSIKAVLFDLDGTLADTAPDLVAALNLSLEQLGHSSVTLTQMRHIASNGSMALVKAALPHASEHEQLHAQQELLRFYEQINGDNCYLFDGIPQLLAHLDSVGLPYGIITNKPARFTRPLIAALGLTSRMKTVISGDSTLFAKPHVAPMLLASQQISVCPENILYLGDAERDLLAAKYSAMIGGTALWGYISDNDQPENWPSQHNFNTPFEVLDFIR